jgi:NhaP-type Na+/H+ or K+/H+ antiporter
MKNEFTYIIITGLLIGTLLMWYGIKFAVWVLYMMMIYPYHAIAIVLALMVTGFIWDKYRGVK